MWKLCGAVKLSRIWPFVPSTAIGVPPIAFSLALGTWAAPKAFGHLDVASSRRIAPLLLLLTGIGLVLRGA